MLYVLRTEYLTAIAFRQLRISHPTRTHDAAC